MRLIRPSYLAVSLAGLLALTVAVSCGDDGTDPNPNPQGDAEIVVAVTADGAARSGVGVSLFAGSGGSVVETGSTNSSGEVTFDGLDAGTYDVEVDLPTGLILDAGEMARKTVTVAANGSADVSFALVDDPGSNVVVVRVVDNRFEPDNVTIEPGTTVRWEATTSTLHTVTPDEHNEWSSASLDSPTDVFTHTFESAGDFDYYCQPHRSVGMTGTISVQ